MTLHSAAGDLSYHLYWKSSPLIAHYESQTNRSAISITSVSLLVYIGAMLASLYSPVAFPLLASTSSYNICQCPIGLPLPPLLLPIVQALIAEVWLNRNNCFCTFQWRHQFLVYTELAE